MAVHSKAPHATSTDSVLEAGVQQRTNKNHDPRAADTLTEEGSKLSEIRNTLFGEKGNHTMYV